MPHFVARHLWRSWPVVEAATSAPAASPPSSSAPKVPERTVRRWRSRLASSARRLVQLLATSASALLDDIVHVTGIDATRAELCAAFATSVVPTPRSAFAELAALIHRLGRGERLV